MSMHNGLYYKKPQATPLEIIMGYTETLTIRFEERPADGESLEALQRIQDSAQRIVKLVTEFLDAFKVEAGKMELVPRPIQLNVLLREVGQQQMGGYTERAFHLGWISMITSPWSGGCGPAGPGAVEPGW